MEEKAKAHAFCILLYLYAVVNKYRQRKRLLGMANLLLVQALKVCSFLRERTLVTKLPIWWFQNKLIA